LQNLNFIVLHLFLEMALNPAVSTNLFIEAAAFRAISKNWGIYTDGSK
jgi:hypothetical protein